MLALAFAATVVAACDSTIAFYMRNDSAGDYFARVTTDRGAVYVHEIGPEESGYATRGVVPGPTGPDYTLELLDSGCGVINTWQMPGDGGNLLIRVDGSAEFTPGYYFEEAPTGDASSGGGGSNASPTAEPFPTVLECDATHIL